jgi:large subunit ribosomal protein L4
MITPDVNTNIILSARNLPKSKVSRASDINTYDILHASSLLIMEGSLPVIEKTLLESDKK